MLLDTIPSLGSELSGCCVYASWEAAPTLNRGKRDTKEKLFESFEVYSDTFCGGTISSRPIFETNKWWYILCSF
jgi:hypothetical protein